MEPSRLNIAGKTATSAQNASKEMKISDRCTLLEQHAFSLRFKSRALEAAYLRGVAASRLPVLIAIASFDICMYLLQLALSTSVVPIGVVSVPKNAAFAQLRNLACLYSLIAAIHWRSMNSGFSAGQGELLLSCLLSGMLTILVRAVGSSQSWVYVSFFLICTSQVLRLRWFVGAAAMALPVIFCICRSLRLAWDPEQDFQGLFPFLKVSTVGIMSSEIMFQLAAAWAVGTLMGFLSDSSRREAFANHRRALAAANTELTEVRARVAAEHELAAAQSVAEARSALAAREKASNEAKSDFISMLCHEIRTPLNGCLASAEMLLQTDLSDDQKELADTVRVSGSILLSTVSNFLDFFKLEAGKSLDVVRTPLCLPTLVGDVHRIIQAMIGSDSDVQLLPPDLKDAPSTVLGDPSRLCGILLNLYMNAAKFTRRGSVGVKVHVVRSDYRPSPPHGIADSDHPSMTSSQSIATSLSQSGEGSGGEGDGSGGSDSDRDAVSPDPAGRGSTLTARNLGYSSSEHDSVTSMPDHVRQSRRRASECGGGGGGWDLMQAPQQAGQMHMLVQEEGDGWLSTASKSSQAPRASMSMGRDGEEKDKVWVCFEVRDTGVGVSPKSLHALFHNYVQGHDSDMEQPRTRSGTGLGLSICGKQVAVLDGTIGALSKSGCGSVFWFTVPMVLAQDRPRSGPVDGGPATPKNAGVQFDSNLENRWQAAAAPTSSTPHQRGSPGGNPLASHHVAPVTRAPLAGLNVLVVEDNLINRKVACRVLQSLGATWQIASNGCEAVDTVLASSHHDGSSQLDAILMDMCMPEMSGVEATRAIRAAGMQTPIVAMTANAMDKDRKECHEAGMDGFLSKPVLREQLMNCLLDLCRPAFNAESL